MLACFAATVAVFGCSNDYDAFQFRSGDDETGGAGSGGSTSGGSGGISTGGTGGVVTGGGGAPTGGGGAPTGGGGAPTGGGGAPTGGGGAPTGGGGAPTGGGGAPTGGGGGPTGGAAGGGGTGGVVSIPGCDDTYGQINGVDQVCLQTDKTCELAYAATTQTCAEICQEGGGVCQAVFNNDPGACGHGQPSDCNNNIFNDAVCVCSRGCGNGPPCPGNQVCNAGGNCQG
jgi:hypothetical protein